MSYNKARAEKEWLKWKNDEEQQLRELGVGEEIIQRLHSYDWEIFKLDRKFYEKLTDIEVHPAAEERPCNPHTVQGLLDEIEDERLLTALQTEDGRTLEILLYKLDGYTNEEIAERYGVSANAVKLRMWKFKKRLKKFL
ncbi:MAG: LuxR C-terminal-related transcriptional regulator [Clostridia bacterium]|nr:LuxR C-terminal-related transcriptional regulator [Clostridia bacterium]